MLQTEVAIVLTIPINNTVMSNQCEIVYYLDSNDMAIIEVEQAGYSGFRSMLWLVYHKATQSVNRFSFRPTFSKTRSRGKKIKNGILKLANKPGNYTIEIDAHIFNFTEQHPYSIPIGAMASIEKYLSTVV
jgi:hypothetical protein